MKYANGDIYDGHYTKNKRQGNGMIHYADGSKKYDGDWYNDMMVVRGEFSYPNGDVFKGEHVKGYKCGNG